MQESLDLIPDDLNDEGLKAAYQEAEKHNWTKEEYDAYIYSGIREQDEKGRVELAVKRKTIQIVENLLKKGTSIEDISDITELSIDQIQNIIDGESSMM